MRYNTVYLETIGYELAPVVVSSDELEEQLAPLYKALHIPPGQLEALTGVTERRWWEPDMPVSEGAIAAGKKALAAAGLSPDDIQTLVYAGVCRENYEPATACPVASGLGLGEDVEIYDVCNACLGVLHGIVEVANKIELGQIRAGLVVSCESARDINETMIARMLAEQSMASFAASLATLTGGSGAVAVLLTDGSFDTPAKHRLLGGRIKSAPQHHNLCQWGLEKGNNGELLPYMRTDAAAVLKNGITLFGKTWEAFLTELDWQREGIDKIVCHQVGVEHQRQILETLRMPAGKDLTTFPYLGNTGTVSVPITAAISAERNQIVAGDRVALLGIGSGLSSLMLGIEW